MREMRNERMEGLVGKRKEEKWEKKRVDKKERE